MNQNIESEMMNFTEQDAYRVEVVSQDLRFLRDEWDGSIKEESLRRSSNVLRSLLVEDQYGKAWRSLGLEKQPVVIAPDLESSIRSIDIQRIKFAQAGGATYNGMALMAALEVNYAMSPEEIRLRANAGPYAPWKEFSLSSLLSSTCIISQGSPLNRRELIKYIANKLGGVHLDLTRNEDKDLERRFKDLDALLRGLQVLDMRSAYFEILSIGQCLARSPDTERFLAIANNAIARPRVKVDSYSHRLDSTLFH